MVAADSGVPAVGGQTASRPARLGLRAGVALDLQTATAAIPFGRLIIPLVAVATAVGIGWFRPGYTSVYGESLAIIVALTVFGTFGRTIGAAVVIAYGVADIAHFVLIADSTIGAQLTRGTLVGRVVLEAILWLLVVIVPTFARRAEAIAEDRLGEAALGRLIGAVTGTVVAGVGTYLWANVMPYLQRAAFFYSPPPPTLIPQQQPERLAIAVAVAFLVVTLALRRRAVAPAEIGPFVGGLPRRGLTGLIVRLVGYAALIVLVSGILAGPRDAAILAAGFLGAEIVGALAARRRVVSLVRGVPASLVAFGGLALALLVALVVGNVAHSIWPAGLDDSPFLPIILATACSVPLARLAFVLAAEANPRIRAMPIPIALLGALLVVGLIAVAFPMSTLADNCANLGDCGFSQRFLLVIGGFAAFFGAGAGALSGGGGQDGGDSGGSGGGGSPGSRNPKGPPPPPEQKPGEEY